MKQLILHIVLLGLLLFVVEGLPTPGVAATAPVPRQTVILDGVTLNVSFSFLATHTLHAADPGNSHQVAATFNSKNNESVSILAVPYGASPAGEHLPPAKAGDMANLMGASSHIWTSSGATATPTVPARLFGQDVFGTQYTWPPASTARGPNGVSTVLEWITDAGNRFWIVRAEGNIAAIVAGDVAGLTMASTTLSAPTTLGGGGSTGALHSSVIAGAQDLSVVAWSS